MNVSCIWDKNLRTLHKVNNFCAAQRIVKKKTSKEFLCFISLFFEGCNYKVCLLYYGQVAPPGIMTLPDPFTFPDLKRKKRGLIYDDTRITCFAYQVIPSFVTGVCL